jgi:hypothetical protein
MFALSKLSNLAAAGGLAVVCLYCFPGRAEEPAQYTGPVGPHEAILTTVGHTRLIAFYEPDGTNCGLNVVMWDSADDSGDSPARIRVSLVGQQTVNIDSVDNKSLRIECGKLAERLSVVESEVMTAGFAQ